MKFLVGTIYRSPGHNLEKFTEDFEYLQTEVFLNSKIKVILTGDSSIGLLKINIHRLTNSYDDTTTHQFLPAVTKHTWITSYSSPLFDDLFTNAWRNIMESTIVLSYISDYLPMLILSFNTLSQLIQPFLSPGTS